MPNENFIEHFTEWLRSTNQTFHIPAKSLHEWRKVSSPARHKAFGLPLNGDVFTDGIHCVSIFDPERGLVKTALNNWEISNPKPGYKGPRKSTKPKVPKTTLADALIANLKL